MYIFVAIFCEVVYLYGYDRKREDFFVNDIERFNITEAIQVAETFSIIGSIDPVENLNNSKVYVYHGRKDTTVESGNKTSTQPDNVTTQAIDIIIKYLVNLGQEVVKQLKQFISTLEQI